MDDILFPLSIISVATSIAALLLSAWQAKSSLNAIKEYRTKLKERAVKVNDDSAFFVVLDQCEDMDLDSKIKQLTLQPSDYSAALKALDEKSRRLVVGSLSNTSNKARRAFFDELVG
jgi:hypothetical protein